MNFFFFFFGDNVIVNEYTTNYAEGKTKLYNYFPVGLPSVNRG